MLLLAGIVLGLTISIRVAGPFAGLLVTAYALMRYGSKSASFFAIYWPIALLTCAMRGRTPRCMCITWPKSVSPRRFPGIIFPC